MRRRIQESDLKGFKANRRIRGSKDRPLLRKAKRSPPFLDISPLGTHFLVMAGKVIEEGDVVRFADSSEDEGREALYRVIEVDGDEVIIEHDPLHRVVCSYLQAEKPGIQLVPLFCCKRKTAPRGAVMLVL